VLRAVADLPLDDETIRLLEQAARPCAELAYGDLKRLELAMALANRPRLLLMDEPTAGMAPGERSALMELAADLARRERLAVLFTEHDMEVVFGHADRVIVLHSGAIIAAGAPAESDPRARGVSAMRGQRSQRGYGRAQVLFDAALELRAGELSSSPAATARASPLPQGDKGLLPVLSGASCLSAGT
jgi:energy-coupling factor transporter ATP-binding protein EcfA2